MINRSEPIFAVSDVRLTVAFYRDVLGFGQEWLWEDPPTFGGARMGNVGVMFSLQPGAKGKTEGLQHWFGTADADTLYERHRAAGAEIISPIGNKPWAAREYTVRDPNGYHLRFGGPLKAERSQETPAALPDYIRIDPRIATVNEYHALIEAVGWKNDPTLSARALAGSLSGVVAIDTRDNSTVGMLRICGDGKFFTIWDVMVAKPHQGRRIGSAMMERALAELRKTEKAGRSVGLFTGNPKFYERLGFEDAGGMRRGL